MKKIISITKMMMKSGTNPFGDLSNRGSNKEASPGLKVFLGFVIFIAIISVGALMVSLLSNLLDLLMPINQEAYAIHLYLVALVFMALFFSIIITPATYYFDETMESYLVLPIKTRDYLSAKWIVNALSTSVLFAPFSILFVVTYAAKVGIAWYTIPYMLIATLLTPLIPISVTVFFIVLLFKAMPFIRNKTLFVYFTSFLGLTFSIGINFLVNSSIDTSGLQEAILAGIKGQSNTLLKFANSFVPSVGLFMDSMSTGNPLPLIVGVLLTLAVIVLTILFTQYNYLESALSMAETAQTTKKLSDKKFAKKSLQNSKFASLMKHDIRNILRTPIYASNYFAPIVIIPIAIGFGLFSSSGDLSELGDLPSLVNQVLPLLDLSNVAIYTASTLIVVGYVMGSLTTMTSTAISREGSNLQDMLLMPVPLVSVIMGKILLGTIVSLIFPTILLVVIQIILKLPIWLFLLALVSTAIGVLCSNIIGILTDVLKPKLNWVNETEAIKENFLAIIPMFLSFGYIGLSAYMVFQDPSTTTFITLASILVVVALMTLIFIRKKGVKMLQKAIQSI